MHYNDYEHKSLPLMPVHTLKPNTMVKYLISVLKHFEQRITYLAFMEFMHYYNLFLIHIAGKVWGGDGVEDALILQLVFFANAGKLCSFE